MKVKYPIYIPSKERSDKIITTRLLDINDISYRLVVEPQECQKYFEVYGKNKCLVLDKNDMGMWYVRRWIKNYSINNGEDKHWQLDDNIFSFKVRLNNKNVKSNAKTVLGDCEFYSDKYINIGISGPIYTTYAFSQKHDVSINRQVSSAILINNKLSANFRADVIEDTDFAMQALTEDNYKWCTILFNRLLIEKKTPGTMAGGAHFTEYTIQNRKKKVYGLINQWGGVFKAKQGKNKLTILPS